MYRPTPLTWYDLSVRAGSHNTSNLIIRSLSFFFNHESNSFVGRLCLMQASQCCCMQESVTLTSAVNIGLNHTLCNMIWSLITALWIIHVYCNCCSLLQWCHHITDIAPFYGLCMRLHSQNFDAMRVFLSSCNVFFFFFSVCEKRIDRMNINISYCVWSVVKEP